MLKEGTIKNELLRINRVLDGSIPVDTLTRRELYGSKQALEWALGRNAMAPAKCALLGAVVVTDAQ